MINLEKQYEIETGQKSYYHTSHYAQWLEDKIKEHPTNPGITITKCKECSERTPVNSHGWGVFCDALGEVLAETDTDLEIPDRCPKRSGVRDGDEYYSEEEIDRIWRLYNQLATEGKIKP